MANSSDWLAAASALPSVPARMPSGWLALLEGEEPAFREALPFGMTASDPVPASPPDPAPTQPDDDARARAYAEGLAAGRAQAMAEAEAAATCQRAVRLGFRALDETAQAVLRDDLAETVIALCDAALAGAAIDRDALLARCHAAARRIGSAADILALHLHPEDIALLEADALGGWRVTPDPALERGSVLIESADGMASDGPADWRRAIAAAVRG